MPHNTAHFSAQTERLVREKLGIELEDPAFSRIIPVLLQARRAGADLDDENVRRLCVEAASESARLEAAERERPERDHWLYYIRVGDLIKIGTAKNLRGRLLTYPPDAELLAVEHGSYVQEQARLTEFNEYRAARREWFTPGPRLMAHIAAIRQPALLAQLLDKKRPGRVRT